MASRISLAVGAVYDRAYFVQSRKCARSQTAPTGVRLKFLAGIWKQEYRLPMGILLFIVAAFFVLGGFHVVGYTALLCAVLFAMFILPAMVITKLLRA